ncbi:zinc finger protein 718-like [Belonocnema kinseyi]|uniref:zinc finger protein 718-like n=1 Tax=Belonocnema kinseyi TaxID=2817044 RepID=UPI00143D1880|nr:zinc finger protein 718-like [Belonocnema kinseyi]
MSSKPQDQRKFKCKSKRSTERQDVGSNSCTTTYLFSGNKSGAKTLIEYDSDETLEIKEEVIQDPTTIICQKGNQANESKFCTFYIRADNFLEVTRKPKTLKKQKSQESKPNKKYTCNKCARSYARKGTLTAHQKFECGVSPQFRCEFCGKLFKWKSDMNVHVDRVHRKKRPTTSILMHKCDKCSQSYRFSGSLNRHKRLEHAAVKPQFSCDVCEYKSKRKSNLSSHIILKHLNKS